MSTSTQFDDISTQIVEIKSIFDDMTSFNEAKEDISTKSLIKLLHIQKQFNTLYAKVNTLKRIHIDFEKILPKVEQEHERHYNTTVEQLENLNIDQMYTTHKKPQAELQGEAQQPQGEAQPEPQSEAHPELQGEAHLELQGEAQPEPQTEAQGEAQPEPQSEAQPEPQREAQGEAHPELQSEAQGEAQPDPQGEAHPDPQGEAQPDPQGEAHPDPQGEAQPDSQGEAQPDPQGEAQPDPQGEAQDDKQAHNLPEMVKWTRHKKCTIKTCKEIQGPIDEMFITQGQQLKAFHDHIVFKEALRLRVLSNLVDAEHQHLQEMEQVQQTFNANLEELEKMFVKLQNEHAENIQSLKKNSCSICLNPWNSTPSHRLISLPCGHLFGDQCIRDYLRTYFLCPQCEKTYYPHDLRYIYGWIS